jgi:ubiquinol-cytochrome c reductase cytochrome b subunit
VSAPGRGHGDQPPPQQPQPPPRRRSGAGPGLRLAHWFDNRTGLISAWHALMRHPIPGGAAWFHALGVMATFLVAVEFVTGLFLAFYYAPSAHTAWASVAFIQDELTAGWFVRGLHSFGATALMVVTALHLLQVLVWGAYRAPRELNWIAGLLLMLVVVGFVMTGFGLPWDQKGYWAKLVETSIAGTVPLVGRLIERVVQGGGTYGNYTVIHLYTVHVFVLPALLVLLLLLHVYLVLRHRLTPHWSLTPADAAHRARGYWPRQAFRDTVGSTIAFLIVVSFVLARRGANLEAPADPASGYMARPDWYAMPLYQLRKYFEGPLEPLATLVIPGVVAGLVAALPFLDRGPDRRPAKRWPVLVLTGLGLAGVGALAALMLRKDAHDPAFQRHRREVAEEAIKARALARRGVLPEGGTAVWKNDPDYEARTLFKDRCVTCHTLDGDGGGEGPDFHDYNSRAWLLSFMKDPYGPRFFGGAKKPLQGRMKPVEGSDDELAALVEFVYGQSGASDVQAPLVQRGQALFSDMNCDACHGIDGQEEARGPNLLKRGSEDYVRRIIEHSGHPVLYGERAKMPRFQGKLTPVQIERLASFVLELGRTSGQAPGRVIQQPASR